MSRFGVVLGIAHRFEGELRNGVCIFLRVGGEHCLVCYFLESKKPGTLGVLHYNGLICAGLEPCCFGALGPNSHGLQPFVTSDRSVRSDARELLVASLLLIAMAFNMSFHGFHGFTVQYLHPRSIRLCLDRPCWECSLLFWNPH